MIIAAKGAAASAGPNNAYWDMVLADDAKSLYKLNETTGSTFADSGPNLVNGTWYNTPTLDQAGPSGTIPSAVSFASASSEYGETPEDADFNVNLTGAWSVEAWIKYSTSGTTIQAFTSVRTGSLESVLVILNVNNGVSGRIQALTYDSTQAFLSVNSDGGWNDNNWHHVAVTAASAGAMKLYVDGTERASTSTARYNWTGNRRFYIGSNTTAQYFNGLVAAPAFYTKALSGTEVSDHWNEGI